MKQRSMWTTLLGVSSLVLLMAMPIHAQTPVEVQVNAFAGASNLPVWVAQREGMFERRGVKVTLNAPKSSVEQFKGLAEGRYPIVVTAFDNVVAYHSGQGAPEVGTLADLVAVMGIDGGLFTLVASPGIQTIADLKGKTVAVDALSTGVSFALKETLDKGGVKESEVSYIAVGNSDNRWKAMQEGKAQAGMLAVPADMAAVAQGSKALATVGSSLGNYLGNVVAVRQSWATSHRSELQAFVGGVSDALTWLALPGNKSRVMQILQAELPTFSAEDRERIYPVLVGSSQGLSRNGALDPRAAQTVLGLRMKYSGAAQNVQKLDAYIDSRYLAERDAAPASK